MLQRHRLVKVWPVGAFGVFLGRKFGLFGNNIYLCGGKVIQDALDINRQ